MAGSAEVARASSERGDLVLLRRDRDGALELRVNGVFVMDSAQAVTERLLARAALDRVQANSRGRPASPVRVLIGGLGLGFTLDEVVRDSAVGEVVVVEIEPLLVDWHSAGLIPQTSSAFADPRVSVQVGDIVEAVEAQSPRSVDAILLDVDNGPGFLVYDLNAQVYRPPFLLTCREASRPGGVTAIWSGAPAPELFVALAEIFRAVEEVPVPVTLGTRETTYSLFLGSSP